MKESINQILFIHHPIGTYPVPAAIVHSLPETNYEYITKRVVLIVKEITRNKLVSSWRMLGSVLNRSRYFVSTTLGSAIPRKSVASSSKDVAISFAVFPRTTTASAAAAVTKRSLATMDTAENFFAWRVDETSDGEFVGSEQCLSKDSLPHNDNGVLINVTHSSLNYKDALSASGNKGVTRNFP